MKNNLLRAAGIAVASTALVAGGATVATAQGSSTAAASSATSTATTATNVSVPAKPYKIDKTSGLRVKKVGKKLTFRFTARYRNDAGRRVGIRKVTLQVKKHHKWRTLKNVKLKYNGTGVYKRTDGKKRTYRMLIKPTSVYTRGYSQTVRL